MPILPLVPLPPHPNPLPAGETERAEFVACSMRCSSGENAGKPACSTSPRWGEVGARSAPGEGARAYRESLAPSPQPSPLRGEGARRVCRLLLQAPVVRTQGAALAPPRPGGERPAREARRVRGQGLIESHLPPHPNPLPCGERERAESAACSCRPLLVRTQGAPLAPPLPGGERSAREARRVRGQG